MKRRPHLPAWPAKPTVRGPQGHWLCRCGCGAEVRPPRRTWATPECIERVRLRCDWAFVRKHVYELSRGLCAACGCHPESLRAKLRESLLDGDSEAVAQALADGWPRLGRVWYEIDHIKPVCEGGHEDGRANLRVLCYRCHKQLTAELNRRRRLGAQPGRGTGP